MKFNFIFKMDFRRWGNSVFRSNLKLGALLLGMACLLGWPARLHAQENYFVTYTQHLEEPGNLELSPQVCDRLSKSGQRFSGERQEFEYGVKTWWTSELYLDWQTTANESSLFTGFRFENRFRPLLKEHWINPVLYVEFENINGADKSLLEVVGHDGIDDFLGRNDRSEKERESRAEADPGQQFQRLEHFRKLYRRKEPQR